MIRACGFSTLNQSFNPSTSSTYAVSLRTRELIVLAISCLFFSSYLPAVIYKWSIFSIPFGVSRQPYIITKVCHAVRIKTTQMYHIPGIGWLHMQQCETAFDFDKYIENSWTYFLLHFTSDLLSSDIYYVDVLQCDAVQPFTRTATRHAATRCGIHNAVDVLRGGFCTALWKVHIHSSYYGVPHWTK